MSSGFQPSINASSHVLDKVFQIRKKTGPYKLIPLKTKLVLKQEFLKNPHLKGSDFEVLSKKTGLPKEKIQDWFKYQRKTCNLAPLPKKVKKFKKKHRFDGQAKILLEEEFRKNPKLETSVATNLKKTLKCKLIHIKRWFYYRNRKLNKIQTTFIVKTEPSSRNDPKPKIEEKPAIPPPFLLEAQGQKTEPSAQKESPHCNSHWMQAALNFANSHQSLVLNQYFPNLSFMQNLNNGFPHFQMKNMAGFGMNLPPHRIPIFMPYYHNLSEK